MLIVLLFLLPNYEILLINDLPACKFGRHISISEKNVFNVHLFNNADTT